MYLHVEILVLYCLVVRDKGRSFPGKIASPGAALLGQLDFSLLQDAGPGS